MFTVQQTPGTVLCCLCGTSIAPNAANMCASCIRTNIDITEGLQKQISVLFCKECGRYLQPPRAWIKAELESKELLTFCLKRIKNLTKVKLIDASFIWTEPHSKRLKVKITIQKEVLHGAILQQSFVVEYTVEDHMCDACSRAAANPDQWVAVVQARQKVDHKRTFLFLEQLILKHGADSNTINIKQMHEGVDFYYANRSHALKFVDFMNSVVPVQFRNDKQLVSYDEHTNSYNYKFTFSVEICPICKEDLVCLPSKAFSALGNVGPLVLCTRVSNSIALLDPNTLRTVYLDANQYWRYAFRPLLSARQLVEYVVLDVEISGQNEYAHSAAGGKASRKFALADVQVARMKDFGKNDTMFTVRTHLGHLLRPGDYALGYDLYGANLNSEDLEKYRSLSIPEVILVRKSYENKRRKRRGKPRPWMLKQLPMEVEAVMNKVEEEREMVDRERFLEEIEEDPEMRSQIAVYRDVNYVPQMSESEDGGTEADGDDPPEIPLEELLSDLTLTESTGGGGEVEEESADMET